MHNNVPYMKTGLCANVQLHSTNLDFNLNLSLNALSPPSPSIRRCIHHAQKHLVLQGNEETFTLDQDEEKENVAVYSNLFLKICFRKSLVSSSDSEEGKNQLQTNSGKKKSVHALLESYKQHSGL